METTKSTKNTSFKVNQVTCFMLYMSNTYDLRESKKAFGDDLGKHIFEKRKYYREIGYDDFYWYSMLDRECQNKLVERSLLFYG